MTRIKDLTELTCILRNVIDDIHKSKKFKKLFFLFLNEKSIGAFKCFIQFINNFIVKNLKHLKSCVNTKICLNFTDSRGRVLYKPCLSIGAKGLIFAKLDSKDICKLFGAGIIKRNRIEKSLTLNILKGRVRWAEKEAYGVLYGQVGIDINSYCSCPNSDDVLECINYDKTGRVCVAIKCTPVYENIPTCYRYNSFTNNCDVVNCPYTKNNLNSFIGLGTSGYSVTSDTTNSSCDCNDQGIDCTKLSEVDGKITCSCLAFTGTGGGGSYYNTCLQRNSEVTCTSVPC